MNDILKKYKQSKIISNTWIVVTSLIIALWINFFVIDWTQLWSSLKTSILNVNSNENKSDIYLENIDNRINLKANKEMKNIKNISLSIVYNPENVSIKNLVNNENQIVNIWNENWINSIILNFETSKNINAWENILQFETEKKIPSSENLNILNANFTDETWEMYMLSTSWITF